MINCNTGAEDSVVDKLQTIKVSTYRSSLYPYSKLRTRSCICTGFSIILLQHCDSQRPIFLTCAITRGRIA
jgi:hypothetical protein